VLNANQKAHLGLLDCIEAAQCSINGKQGPGISQQLGLQIVYNAYASLTTPDFTSQCQAAKNAGVQVFFLSMDPNSIHRIARSCLSINFRPLYTTGVSVLVPTLSSDPNLDGLVGGVAVAPWMLAGTPAVAAYQAVLHRYAPGLTPDNASMEGWVSAQLFQLAARSMPDQPTSQAVLQGLWVIRGNDLGGLTMPVTFIQGQDAPRTTCWFTVAIKSGQWTSPNNGARGCV
jgi:branched-chain amino acid transport system substrate-binding protein